MKKTIFKQILMLLALTAIMIIPYFVFAQNAAATAVAIDGTASSNPMTMLKTIGEKSFNKETNENTFVGIAGLVVNIALSILGVIFIVLMIIAGYTWMMASGNEQKVTESKSIIKRAIIGLIIVLASWAIWNLIFTTFIDQIL
ncbi:MAG: hypothetical protein EOM88_02935 [Clostridia bacterium]|nr:hypothetical protein [Clostridia bacterium]